MQQSLIVLLLMGECAVMVFGLFEYHFIMEEKNWTEAQLYCRENHTDLVTVTDMAEMNRLLTNSSNMTQAWIGLYDPVQGDRSWYWSLTGERFEDNVSYWEAGEPNDIGIENCGAMTNLFKWVDMSCLSQRLFLCFKGNETSKKYYLIKDKRIWIEAQDYCRENHTDLVSGLNQLDDPLLKQTFDSEYNSTQLTYIYIGFFRDSWRWSDGSSFSFRHWNLQMNIRQKNTGRCAMIDGDRWKDENCSESKPFICYNDKLILIKENKTWEEALIYCRDHHHDLVTIINISEQQKWVHQKVEQASTPFVWIGLRYNCPRDIWFWVCKRENMTMSRASGRSTDDCNLSGAIETAGEHRWFERNSTELHNFICSKG